MIPGTRTASLVMTLPPVSSAAGPRLFPRDMIPVRCIMAGDEVPGASRFRPLRLRKERRVGGRTGLARYPSWAAPPAATVPRRPSRKEQPHVAQVHHRGGGLL